MAKPVKVGEYGPAWRVRYVRRLANDWGWCDFAKREIVVSNETKRHGIDREMLMHEAIHKIMPFLDEDCVRMAAFELDSILEACGH